jgi:hypothetical protein
VVGILVDLLHQVVPSVRLLVLQLIIRNVRGSLHVAVGHVTLAKIIKVRYRSLDVYRIPFYLVARDHLLARDARVLLDRRVLAEDNAERRSNHLPAARLGHRRGLICSHDLPAVGLVKMSMVILLLLSMSSSVATTGIENDITRVFGRRLVLLLIIAVCLDCGSRTTGRRSPGGSLGVGDKLMILSLLVSSLDSLRNSTQKHGGFSLCDLGLSERYTLVVIVIIDADIVERFGLGGRREVASVRQGSVTTESLDLILQMLCEEMLAQLFTVHVIDR